MSKMQTTPQLIRISGANVVDEPKRLELFSEFESTLLEHQIACKEKLIKELIFTYNCISHQEDKNDIKCPTYN